MQTTSESTSTVLDELLLCEYRVQEVDPYKTLCKQCEVIEGVYVILEGECYLSCDLRKVDTPEMLVDHRETSLNLISLKESLSKLIIPSRSDHDISKSMATNETCEGKSKNIRRLMRGDKIGDFEYCLKKTTSLFTVTNSDKMLRLALISTGAINKSLKHNPQNLLNIIQMVTLKCDAYISKNVLATFFTNIKASLLSAPRKMQDSRPKTAKGDFEATLRLYELDSSSLVVSRVPRSMSILLKTKLAEGYWHKKIEERKFAQQKENDIKINYFRSFHQQSARSRKQLEQLRRTESPREVSKELVNSDAVTSTASTASRARLVSTSKIPINHPSVANVWMILKAVNRFKNNSRLFQIEKFAKSKQRLQKNNNCHKGTNYGDEKEDEIEFDIETGEKNLKIIESKIKNFITSLPQTSKSDGVTSLKRYMIAGKSIPQVGGTVLVRLRQCSDLGDHMHVHHHILPKDALSTLQKYRVSKSKEKTHK